MIDKNEIVSQIVSKMKRLENWMERLDNGQWDYNLIRDLKLLNIEVGSGWALGLMGINPFKLM